MTDVERRERLAFAIRAAMAGRTAQDVADAIEPKRSKETIARWARGDTVPSALDVGPLARALGVRPDLLNRCASRGCGRARDLSTNMKRPRFGGAEAGYEGMRLGLVLCIAAIVTACTGSASSDKPTGASVSGSGNMNSKPFHLDGNYSVKWAATPQSNVGCFHSATLRSVADGGREDTIMGVTLHGAAQQGGTANLYAVASGEYFVKVITGCGAWRFDFTPS